MAAELTTTVLTVPDGAGDEVLEITGASANSYRLSGLAVATGETYTLSVWAMAAAAMTVEFRVLGSVFTASVTTDWQKLVFTAESVSTDYVDISPGSDSALYLYKAMLQRGQFDTDWKPAPEDVDAALERQEASVNQTVSEMSTSLTQTAEELVLNATKSLVTQTEFESYQEEVSSSFTQQADSFELKITTSVGAVEDKADANAEQLSAITNYIRYDAEGSLILGSSAENALKLQLRSDRISFLSPSGDEIAYWDGDTLHTGNIHIDTTQRAQFGNFAFQPRSGGDLVLLKVGG